MAYFKFVQAIATGQAINVYNFGKMKRDFTYIDDIIEGVVRVMRQPPSQPLSEISNTPHPLNSQALYRLYNLGNNNPIELMEFIQAIEQALGKPAKMNFLPMQPGDVLTTYADVSDLMRDTGFKPTISLEIGIQRFVQWYRAHQNKTL